MELLHIHKDTWAAVGATALIPFYRLTDTDIVLLDTGIAASDREGLTALLEEHGLRPKGILCSHAHYDHAGGLPRFFAENAHAKCQRDGCLDGDGNLFFFFAAVILGNDDACTG